VTVRIDWLDEVDSTNAEARRRADAGEGGPLWIAARRQTAGRGRRGRAWLTAQGNLAATYLATTTLKPAEAAGVSFVAALAVFDAVRGWVAERRVSLKWPNDVLIDDRKVAGVLVESGPREGGLWFAVGIGLNLASAPADVERPAIAVAEACGGAPPPDGALELLSAAFGWWLGRWGRDGLAPILEAWSARASGIPGPCTVRLGGETLEGHAEGLDTGGRLRLRLPDGSERLIAAGDVFFGGG
jgi:BirA family biotin operon repressor/biotin-[acetyl-CoA-carboxylase] ligase